MVVILLGLLGLVFGSFVNAAVWRIYTQEEVHHSKRRKHFLHDADLSIITGRSICTHCGHTLSLWDLIPVFSYVFLGGKCRYCHEAIEDTPLAEVVTAILFVVSYIWWPYVLNGSGLTLGWMLFWCWLLFIIGFVILALYDIRWMLLPDRVVFPLIGLGIVQTLLVASVYGQGLEAIIDAGWGVAVIAGLFYALYAISKHRWIGFGDVKLAIVLGLLVGGPLSSLLLIFMASVLGSLAAVPLLLRGKSFAKTHIPFGPFLLLAAIIVVLFGGQIINWYLGLLHLPPQM
jgi:prepilin signal peptidase PulO-like enzyme (type II secretory pathway)